MKRLILFTICICFSFVTYGQNNTKTDFWENVRFGGRFGLNFSNNNTLIAIAPTAVYKLNDIFSFGGGLGYTYSKNGDYKTNLYTGSMLAILAPYQNLELSTELAQSFVNQKLGTFSDTYNYPSLFLGLAYRVGNVAIGGRYDVLYDEDKNIYASPFSPFVRVFF